MKLLTLVVVAALGFTAGCAAVTTPPPVSAQQTLIDERALFAAEAAYNVAANAYLVADGQGVLSAPVKAQAKGFLGQAYAALRLARSAYTVGDARSYAAQVAAVLEMTSRASAMVGAR